MIRSRFVIIFLFCFIFISCNYNNINNIFGKNKNENKTNIEKDYIPNKIWTLETNYLYCCSNSRQYGKYYYIQEFDRTKKGEFFYYSKIDLSNGARVWRSKTVEGSPRGYPIPICLNGNNYIIIPAPESRFCICNDETGEVVETISFYETDEGRHKYALANDVWINIGTCLYWGNVDMDTEGHPGLVKLDLSKVDFTKPAGEIQYIKPELVWENPENEQRFLTFPVEKDGIIYFITFNQWEQDDFCFIGAYDTKKEAIKWLRKSEIMTGYGFNNMYILDDKLYILEEERGCYELETGKVIWEQRTTQEEYMTSVGVGAGIYSLGITYWNGRFYFTNSGGWASSSMTGIPEEYIKNIQCIDAETGKYIWGDLPKDSGSLFTRPIIIDNQCFVVVWDGLRVYNATTGELIGVDKSVVSHGSELGAEWDGMFIYFDTDERNLASTLIAIKPY